MVAAHAVMDPVAVRHATRRGSAEANIAIDPSPDWCDGGDVPPHVVGVVIDLPPETREASVSLPAAPAECEAPPVAARAADLPVPAVVFLALLVAGYAAGFGIGLFGRP